MEQQTQIKSGMTKKEIIFLLVAVLLFFGLLYAWNIMEKNRTELNQAQSTIENLNSKVKTYVDENGNLHGQVEILKINKDLYKSMNAKQLDSIANTLNIKIKNIASIMNLSLENQGSISARIDTQYKVLETIQNINNTTVVKYDTVKVYPVNYKDAYMNFNGLIENGKLNATYSVYDSLKFVTFTKNTGFLGLGNKKTFIDVETKNPNVKFSQMNNIELTDVKVKKFSLGPCINYGYNGEKFQPSIGISLQYSVIRF